MAKFKLNYNSIQIGCKMPRFLQFSNAYEKTTLDFIFIFYHQAPLLMKFIVT